MPADTFQFLVVGAGRGGTSLLAGLLDYHESLEVKFEHFSEGYLAGVALTAPGPDIFEARVKAFVRACRDEAAQYPDKIYGNKITTEQVFGLEDHNLANPGEKIDVLEQFFCRHLRGIKVVFVLRDGRTCVRSKVSRTGQSVALACARWKYSVDVYRFLMSRHDNRICVRYEDLLLDPARTLGDVCSFLGVPYQESMLRGTANDKLRPEYRQPRLDISRLGLQDIPAGCLDLIRDDLERCGYA